MGTGTNVKSNVSFMPEQPFKVGVTMTRDVWVVVILRGVKLILPMPLAPNSGEGLLFVQVKTVPAIDDVKFITIGVEPQ